MPVPQISIHSSIIRSANPTQTAIIDTGISMSQNALLFKHPCCAPLCGVVSALDSSGKYSSFLVSPDYLIVNEKWVSVKHARSHVSSPRLKMRSKAVHGAGKYSETTISFRTMILNQYFILTDMPTPNQGLFVSTLLRDEVLL